MKRPQKEAVLRSPPAEATVPDSPAPSAGQRPRMLPPSWWNAAILVLLVGITISWRPFDRSAVQRDPTARLELKAVSSESRGQRNHDLAAAFAEDPNSLSDEDYQRAARAYEEQKRAERAAAKRPAEPPDPLAPYRRWHRWRRRVEKVQEMLRGSEEFPKGSIQWHMREELKQLLQEQPRQP